MRYFIYILLLGTLFSQEVNVGNNSDQGFGLDDVIGTITIPLSDIVSQCQSNNEYKFDGPLIDRGLIQGTLSGTITMVAPKFDPRMAVQYSMTSMSGGCCLIS